MSEIDQGGFVYPQVTYAYGEEVRHTGITRRDHLAAVALPELLADFFRCARDGMPFQEDWRIGVAKDAYMMADAMIEAGK